jgi:hypothetical protein
MLRLILKFQHSVPGPNAPLGTRRWLAGEKLPPDGLPLVANPYHQMGLKGNSIYDPAGGCRSGYRERLAMIASPIVALADDFDAR